MRNASVLVQVTLFIIAIVVVWLYVYPSFMDISDRQDQISEYGQAIDEATQVNEMLAGLVQSIEAIPAQDRERMSTYLPSEIDPIVVQRDILAYVQRYPLQLLSLNQTGDVETYDDAGVQIAQFSLALVGQYQDIKDMLTDIESHHYPLHLERLDIEPATGDALQVSVTFITYAEMANNN